MSDCADSPHAVMHGSGRHQFTLLAADNTEQRGKRDTHVGKRNTLACMPGPVRAGTLACTSLAFFLPTMMGSRRLKCTSVIISLSAGWKKACAMFLPKSSRGLDPDQTYLGSQVFVTEGRVHATHLRDCAELMQRRCEL